MVDGVLSCYERAIDVAPVVGQVLGA